MCHNNDILAPLELHNDGLETYDNVTIGFTTSIAVIVFVVVTGPKIFGILVCDLLIGKAVADARVELVEGFPFEFAVAGGGVGEDARGLDSAF